MWPSWDDNMTNGLCPKGTRFFFFTMEHNHLFVFQNFRFMMDGKWAMSLPSFAINKLEVPQGSGAVIVHLESAQSSKKPPPWCFWQLMSHELLFHTLMADWPKNESAFMRKWKPQQSLRLEVNIRPSEFFSHLKDIEDSHCIGPESDGSALGS